MQALPTPTAALEKYPVLRSADESAPGPPISANFSARDTSRETHQNQDWCVKIYEFIPWPCEIPDRRHPIAWQTQAMNGTCRSVKHRYANDDRVSAQSIVEDAFLGIFFFNLKHKRNQNDKKKWSCNVPSGAAVRRLSRSGTVGVNLIILLPTELHLHQWHGLSWPEVLHQKHT